jgi:GNAT superfamily N-acetyltransferase
MTLTIEQVAADPQVATYSVELTDGSGILTPLLPGDVDALGAFFAGLLARTRRFYDVTTPVPLKAQEYCEAIGRYDKLRLVLRPATTTDAARTRGGVQGRHEQLPAPIIAIVEFSFDVPAGDLQRYAGYGIELDSATDCRWGLCIDDRWQGQGVGTALAAPSFDLAWRFGQRRVILWGGVYADNVGAIAYYRKVGFVEVGRFTNDRGVRCVDMMRAVSASHS